MPEETTRERYNRYTSELDRGDTSNAKEMLGFVSEQLQNFKTNQAGSDNSNGFTPLIDRSIRDTQPEVRTPQSVDQIYGDLSRVAQKEINALSKHYSNLVDEQRSVNEERSRSTAAVNSITGLAGSTEANQTVNRTNKENTAAIKAIKDEQNLAVAQILGKVRQSAVEEARAQREDYRLDLAASDERRAAAKTEAIENASMLAASGVTAKGYAETDPEGYAYLAQQVGGDQVLQSMFTLNRPKESILDKRIENGKYVIAYENPLDGGIRIETVDLGLPPQYTKTIDAGNRILAIPDNWDGDPSALVTINKGLTPGQALSDGGGGAAGGSGTYTSDLDALVGNVYNIIPSLNGKEAFQNSIARSRDDADKIKAIATVVLRNSPGEVRNDFIKQAQGVRSIDAAIAKLDEGVQTGVLQNGAQYLFNVVGKDYDPGLQAISASITAAIQPYRSSVTGAAWGDQEDAEYANMFGSTRYSPAELRQRLVNVKQILTDKSATALTTQVSPFAADPIFGDSYYGSTGSSVRDQAEAAGYDYDAMKADGVSDEDIQAALNNR